MMGFGGTCQPLPHHTTLRPGCVRGETLHAEDAERAALTGRFYKGCGALRLLATTRLKVWPRPRRPGWAVGRRHARLIEGSPGRRVTKSTAVHHPPAANPCNLWENPVCKHPQAPKIPRRGRRGPRKTLSRQWTTVSFRESRSAMVAVPQQCRGTAGQEWMLPPHARPMHASLPQECCLAEEAGRRRLLAVSDLNLHEARPGPTAVHHRARGWQNKSGHRRLRGEVRFKELSK